MPKCPVHGCGATRFDSHAMQIHLQMAHNYEESQPENGETVMGKSYDRTEAQNKVCPNKKCTLHNKTYLTGMRLCGVCGTKLQVQYNKITPIDVGRADPVMGAPYPADQPKPPDEWVFRKHMCLYTTVTDTATGSAVTGWHCWCGFVTQLIGDTKKHEEQPYEKVLKSTLNVGDHYIPITPSNDLPKIKDDWTCAPDVQGCPIMTDAMRPKLEVPQEMWDKWIKLAARVDTEWLAYLIGEPIPPSDKFPKGGWTVTDFYFPHQRVTAAHVQVSEDDLRNLRPGVIGDVHSHVRMNAYFSSEDESHFNHNVHVVVNARGEFATSVRVELDCKRTSRTKGALYLTGEDPLAELVMGLENMFTPDPPNPPAAQASLPASSVSTNAESSSVNGVETSVHSPAVVTPPAKANGSTNPTLVAKSTDDDDDAIGWWGM